MKAQSSSMFVALCVLILVYPNRASGLPQFPAMFVFGDSLIDPGNNNYLLNSMAKANFFPYGIDFPESTTGRFCNGKTIIDFLGDLLDLPRIPPFVYTLVDHGSILQGVNYASAAAGILDETGKTLGGRFPLLSQVRNFKTTLRELRARMGEPELADYLAKSLVVMNLGNNDYLNNYLKPYSYSSSSDYNTTAFADLLIANYTTQIEVLYGLGLRKFMLAAVGPLGCMPNQIARGIGPHEKCLESDNDMVRLFNQRLLSLVNRLNAMRRPKAIFVYGNSYDGFINILNNAENYGLKVVDTGCCGIGRNKGQVTCLPMAFPCFHRDQYVFWDAFHPTEAVNRLMAQRAYNGSTSDCYPMNIMQMARI